MKRKIEFRGKPVDQEEYGDWVEGYYVEDLDGEEVKPFIFICPMWIEVMPETVGQFTGLYDKNSKEIYEGDLIRRQCYDGNEYTGLFEVIYSESGFCLKMRRRGEKILEENLLLGFWYYENNKLREGEVIGNVYDNPELLTNNH